MGTHLKVADVARAMGVTPHTVREWLKLGHLNGSRVGPKGRWMIDQQEVRRLQGAS